MTRLAPALRGSLRARLLLGTLAWILVSVLGAGWALSDLFQQHLARQLVVSLDGTLDQLAAGLDVDAQGRATLAPEPADPRLARPFSGRYWQVDRVADDGGQDEPVFRSRSLWDQSLALARDAVLRDGLHSLSGPGGAPALARVRLVRPDEGAAHYRLISAADAAVLAAPLARFQRMAGIFLGLLALGLGAAALVQVVVGLRPLQRLRAALEAVRRGQTTQIAGRFPGEVQPLVDAFNAVLRHNDAIVTQARTQAGDLAHALKTPLAVLSNAATQQNDAFSTLVREQTALARRQVDHHLARARATAAARSSTARTPLAPVVDALLYTLARLHADKALQWHGAALPETLAVQAEHQDVQEMLGNLLDNAGQWARSAVWLSVQAPAAAPGAPARVEIRIEDDGPGLTAAQRERIFQRGVRMDERTPGSGLGLAIVRDLAEAYGGSVQAQASTHGGLALILRLPGAPAQSAG